ncbi:hypothetical protein G6F50_014169 [Rhizopus delemar]|uniref:Uncharacterized protein n=1 Tax=Rhizopus delemar TaxID=936053 RepID=A0A9P7C9A5_9FUNG|nr:hypothetical protein G6F50_014169 [Rhizopus delemar]
MQGGRHGRIDIQFQRQSFVQRHRPQRLQQALQHRRNGHLLDFHGGLSGFDLGQVKNVVDQRQQVAAGGINRLCVLDLLGAQVARLVVRQQLGQDQRRIQGRAQFVAHGRHEIRFGMAARLGLGPAHLLVLYRTYVVADVLHDQQYAARPASIATVQARAVEQALPMIEHLRQVLADGDRAVAEVGRRHRSPQPPDQPRSGGPVHVLQRAIPVLDVAGGRIHQCHADRTVFQQPAQAPITGIDRLHLAKRRRVHAPMQPQQQPPQQHQMSAQQ